MRATAAVCAPQKKNPFGRSLKKKQKTKDTQKNVFETFFFQKLKEIKKKVENERLCCARQNEKVLNLLLQLWNLLRIEVNILMRQ